MKMLVARVLQSLARKQIRTFHPTVIAVTGSVGKTSTKTAIAIALSAGKNVRTANKNYNNEFGVPLAIFGEYSPGKDVWGWLKLVVRQLRVKTFPNMLVLEYGADKPGDIQASCNIAAPDIAVVTTVSPVHVANYPNFGALIEEKASLVQNITKDGLAILNADDISVAQMRKKTDVKVLTYGKAGHDAVITDIYTKVDDEGRVMTKAAIVVEGQTVNLILKNVIGDAVVSACAAALLVAKHSDVDLTRAAKALGEQLRSAPGRMNPLSGIKGTVILDDSYNAAPASVHAALNVLSLFKTLSGNARRMAVLGTMAELGQYADQEHADVGRHVAEVADVFIAVGPLMAKAADVALQHGMNTRSVIRCADAVEAGRWLDTNIHGGDIILVKGSQSARMEKAVKDIIADPLRAEELLCRQEEYWKHH